MPLFLNWVSIKQHQIMESKPHSFRWTFLKFVSSKKSKSFTMIYCISIKKWNTKKMHLSLWNSQTFYVFGYPVSLTFPWLNFSIFPYILSFLNWNAYLINANFIPMLTWFRNCLNCFDQNLLHFCWANLFMHIFGVHIIFNDVPFMLNCSLRYRRKK